MSAQPTAMPHTGITSRSASTRPAATRVVGRGRNVRSLITTRFTAPGEATILVCGQLDGSTALLAWQVLRGYLRSGGAVVKLDLSHVTDSAPAARRWLDMLRSELNGTVVQTVSTA